MKFLNKKNIFNLILILSIYFIVEFLINRGIIDSYIILNIVVIGVNIILAVSLNLITGITGQFSLGHLCLLELMLQL